MNLKTKLAAAMVLAASASMANATTYNVYAEFVEAQTMQGKTWVQGTFDWDPATLTISNLSGTMNQSMDMSVPYSTRDFNYQLGSQTINGNLVTAYSFYINSTATYRDNGYDPTSGMMPSMRTNPQNNNGYFGLTVDASNPYDLTGTWTASWSGIVSDNTLMEWGQPINYSVATPLSEIRYADCTPGGLMGQMCMTGHYIPGSPDPSTIFGTMNAFPSYMTITAAAVPVPGAVWLFGGALMSLFGVNRRKLVLSA